MRPPTLHPRIPSQLPAFRSSSLPRCYSISPAITPPILPTTTSALRHSRCYHDYFVTNLPSSSMHPDGRIPHHKLPRDKSTPHDKHDDRHPPAAAPSNIGASREMTVVRIPLKSAKHHFGAAVSRGSRPYNEDAHQEGTIEIPAFAKRRPISLTRSARAEIAGQGTSADSASGDPQVFYFGVFDGHGGAECSKFLQERLHLYVEEAGREFGLESSLKKGPAITGIGGDSGKGAGYGSVKVEEIQESRDVKAGDETAAVEQSDALGKAEELEKELVSSYKQLVGGYYRRFKPEYFSINAGGKGYVLEGETARQPMGNSRPATAGEGIGIETVLEYAFLKADYDFISAQANKEDADSVLSDRALNEHDIIDKPSRTSEPIGGPKTFQGGSTSSIALISTPSPTPFWHPSSPSTLITSHVGDTRILLCATATGLPVPLTSNHHPSDPVEATRLRRYAATFVTDSFGEERMIGLANTRSFGDMKAKRIGVSAEPEIRRVELSPAEYSFLVLVSDGVSGVMSDEEIVDVVKEAKTPEQGAKDLVSFAVEVSASADNATALVVRLGGWERRSEGGLGSLGTQELRDWRKMEAQDPRARRQ
ncbi:protein phosphatase-like protein 2c [Eremomyces bilateralis CBS 781.70]|uniref:Protein phosphatase-like protein 2c n=1 Tax=Eremomyces bilateralis CBS 781.70 TaxID=1392243 RepID=A0A6G1FV54_9PEZI|nr:protein phosphatase-like protein 2c [Eremomyces bilateralis CBS 781.70]KAF1809562.1 protein phosphatase-like protein 2c [Eremomyces bilateralis CBS 781.70]